MSTPAINRRERFTLPGFLSGEHYIFLNHMDQTTKPLYAALLERAVHNLRTGFLNTARTLAADAIDEMVPTFSPNNPKLADAYRLHANICLTHFVAAGYHPSKIKEYERDAIVPRLGRYGKRIDAAGLFNSWRKSALAEIEVLSLGMDTERLAQAKFEFGSLITHEKGLSDKHLKEAVEMKARLIDVSADVAHSMLLGNLCEGAQKLFDRANAMEVGSLTG